MLQKKYPSLYKNYTKKNEAKTIEKAGFCFKSRAKNT